MGPADLGKLPVLENVIKRDPPALCYGPPWVLQVPFCASLTVQVNLSYSIVPVISIVTLSLYPVGVPPLTMQSGDQL